MSEEIEKYNPKTLGNKDVASDLLEETNAVIVSSITELAIVGSFQPKVLAGVIGSVVAYKMAKNTLSWIGDKIKNKEIKEDYTNSEIGLKSLVELLKYIDSEIPEEDRLEAIKKMFYFVNKVGVEEKEQMVNYELFKISTRLNSSQLLILKVSYEQYQIQAKEGKGGGNGNTEVWSTNVANWIGHEIPSLVANEEKVLVDNGLIKPSSGADNKYVNLNQARLTKLGITFYEKLNEL